MKHFLLRSTALGYTKLDDVAILANWELTPACVTMGPLTGNPVAAMQEITVHGVGVVSSRALFFTSREFHMVSLRLLDDMLLRVGRFIIFCGDDPKQLTVLRAVLAAHGRLINSSSHETDPNFRNPPDDRHSLSYLRTLSMALPRRGIKHSCTDHTIRARLPGWSLHAQTHLSWTAEVVNLQTKLV